MKKIKRLAVNSFPRSGNVYFASVCSQLFNLDTVYTTHLPEIFVVKDLALISIFRKPEDSISSLIYKYYKDETLTQEFIENQIKRMTIQYKDYIDGAKNNYENIYIVKFDNLINNPLQHCIKIGEKFDINMQENYENFFNSMEFSGTRWTDPYEGHLPREKNEQRILIDSTVHSWAEIKDLNKEYEDFIAEYETFKTL